MYYFTTRMTSTATTATLKRMATGVIVPTIPVLIWWKWATDDRRARQEQVRTKVRVPNVQTVDDLLIETCRAGDVILFDRRPYKCAAGPFAALACALTKWALCPEDANRVVEVGKFDQVGESMARTHCILLDAQIMCLIG